MKVLQEESTALRTRLEGIFTTNYYAHQHASQRRQLFAGAVRDTRPCVTRACKSLRAQDHAVTVNSLVAEGQALGRSDTMLDDINDTAGNVLLRLQAQGGTLKVRGSLAGVCTFRAISLHCREFNAACSIWQRHLAFPSHLFV